MMPVLFVGGCAGGIRLESELSKQTAPFDPVKRAGVYVVFKPAASVERTLIRADFPKDFERNDGTFLVSALKGSITLRGSYEVLESAADGSWQVIETFENGDIAKVWSRYRATRHAIEPLSRRVFGFGMGFFALPIAVCFVWLCRRLGRYLAKRFAADAVPVRGELVEP
jgi:hypothetical protein